MFNCICSRKSEINIFQITSTTNINFKSGEKK